MAGLRRLLWLGVGIAVLVLLGTLAWRGSQQEGVESAVGQVGAPFELVDSKGKPFSSRRLDGRPHAVFFGFTHCPDVCPTTLARLAKLRKELGKGDKAFDIVFISVDPERDTPADMDRYAGLFGTPIIALTGSVAQVDKVKHDFGIYAEKVPLTGGGYTVDHTATVLLFDADGSFAGTIAPDEADANARAKLARISVG